MPKKNKKECDIVWLPIVVVAAIIMLIIWMLYPNGKKEKYWVKTERVKMGQDCRKCGKYTSEDRCNDCGNICEWKNKTCIYKRPQTCGWTCRFLKDQASCGRCSDCRWQKDYISPGVDYHCFYQYQ